MRKNERERSMKNKTNEKERLSPVFLDPSARGEALGSSRGEHVRLREKREKEFENKKKVRVQKKTKRQKKVESLFLSVSLLHSNECPRERSKPLSLSPALDTWTLEETPIGKAKALLRKTKNRVSNLWKREKAG